MPSALVKIKNPVEYSFYSWIKGYPESSHPCDTKRFLIFVKNVCCYNATRWKDICYLEKRILKEVPNCNLNWLEDTLIIFEHLIDFHRIAAIPRSWSIEIVEKKSLPGHYFERYCKNGEFFEREIQIHKDH